MKNNWKLKLVINNKQPNNDKDNNFIIEILKKESLFSTIKKDKDNNDNN